MKLDSDFSDRFFVCFKMDHQIFDHHWGQLQMNILKTIVLNHFIVKVVTDMLQNSLQYKVKR